MDVCLVIKARLKELGVEQKDLAAAAEVTESYVSQLLTRKKLPPAPDRTQPRTPPTAGHRRRSPGRRRDRESFRHLHHIRRSAVGRCTGRRPGHAVRHGPLLLLTGLAAPA